MKAMILAAGRGTRMGALTQSIPKPLLPLAGMPLIEYHVRALVAAEIREIVVNVSWLGDQIVEELGDGERFGASIVYSKEPDTALETAGGIAHALPLLGRDPFVVVNGDIWTDFPLHHLRDLGSDGFDDSDLAHLVMVNNPVHNPHGDFYFVAERHAQLECNLGRLRLEPETRNEKPVEPEQSRLTFSGIGLYRAEFFASVTGRAALGPLFSDKIAQDQISASCYAGLWWDVGTPQRLDLVEAFLCNDDSGPSRTRC